MTGTLWEAVDGLVDRCPEPENLRGHRLQLLAAKRWRETGRSVPEVIVLDELQAFVRMRAAHRILADLGAAYDGPVMVLKGLEIAAYYPAPELRVVTDLDVLVEDAERAYEAAVAAGFHPVGYDERYYAAEHHVRPLVHPDDRTIVLEIHRRPNWVPWALAPSAPELIASGAPSRLGVPGLLAPPPEQHAVLAAVHSWNDTPLRRVGDLLDVLALLQHAPDEAADEIAARWGVAGVWQTTVSGARTVILSQSAPWWLSRFASDLLEIRDRTVFENHLRTWMGPLLALPLRGAIVELGYVLHSELVPQEGESWGNRARRIWAAARNLNRANREHLEVMGTRPGGAAG